LLSSLLPQILPLRNYWFSWFNVIHWYIWNSGVLISLMLLDYRLTKFLWRISYCLTLFPCYLLLIHECLFKKRLWWIILKLKSVFTTSYHPSRNYRNSRVRIRFLMKVALLLERWLRLRFALHTKGKRGSVRINQIIIWVSIILLLSYIFISLFDLIPQSLHFTLVDWILILTHHQVVILLSESLSHFL
jgi:hypothetical protein